MLLENSFEGGTHGVAITPANSGGTSGDAFTQVNPAITYSNVRAAHGTLSAEFPADTSAELSWQGKLSGSGDRYARAYMWLDQPTGDGYHGLFLTLATTNRTIHWAARIWIFPSYASLELYHYNSSTGISSYLDTAYPSVAAITKKWIRLELRANNAAAGSGEARLFADPESTTPAVTASGTITQTALAWDDAFVSNTSPGMRSWVDDFKASDVGWPGPAAGLVPPTGLTATPASASQINLAWDSVPLATAYDVQRQRWDGTAWTGEQTTRVQAITYADTGLAAATRYRYRVRSVT
ncbi:hypothetical protein ACFY05_41955 [Microtetraspora fusca]|uniref:Fibronectin type-III domain-containing protein n=1 Tax=Microtetraspora fusca TaxID=1997 RepID=A0ABW6VJY4_MICFU